MGSVPGAEREALGEARLHVEYQLAGVPCLVLLGVHVERAPGDHAEQHVARTGEVLAGGEAHRGAAPAAAGRLDEHQRAAGGQEAADRLLGCPGRDDAPRGGLAAATRRNLTAAGR